MMHPGPWSRAQAEARLAQVNHLLAEAGLSFGQAESLRDERDRLAAQLERT